MSTNFGKLDIHTITDRNALFTIGTKREEMENKENSLFCHPLRKFDRTDKNKNGVIEADELLSRIKREKIEDIAWNSFLTLETGAMGYYSVKYFKQLKPILGFIAATVGCLCAECSLKGFSNVSDRNREIKVLKEYVAQQKAEETAA